MSDESKQEDGELFDTESSEGEADAESTTDDQKTESDGEEIKEDVDLDIPEEESKKSIAEEQKLKQIDTWANRISNGEKDLSDIPQKWLREAVEKALKVDIDVESIIEKKMKEKEIQSQFTLLKKSLNDAKLSPVQRKEVSSEFKQFVKEGLNKTKALQLAIKIAGIELESDESYRNMNIPKPGKYQKAKAKITEGMEYSEIYENVPEKERLEYLKRLTDPQFGT